MNRTTKYLFILGTAGTMLAVSFLLDESPANAQGIIRSVRECSRRIVKPRKIRRCQACIRRGGVFHRQGGNRGFCKMQRRNTEPPIRSVPGCRNRIRKPNKRMRCVACIRRGGFFHRDQGNRGRCTR